jgi:predicted methyltransferase
MSEHGETPARDVLGQVAERTNLREGPEGVRAVLRALHDGGTLGTRDIAEAARLPLPIVAAIRGELAKLGLVEKRDRGAGLTLQGETFAAELFGNTPTNQPPDTSSPDTTDAEFLRELGDIAGRRPAADPTLDQAKATPATLARRVAYFATNDGITGRKVVCIGDDDFTSAAIAAWSVREEARGNAVAPKRLCALDIDERIVDALGDGVDARVWNACDVVPEGLVGAFDVVITDPPYTPAGAELFLSRAIDLVGARAGAHCFLSFGHSDPATMRRVQASLAEMGWVIVEWRPSFNAYEGGTVIAGTSLMAHLILAPDAKPIVTGHYEGTLYTADARPMIRAYRCKSCRAEWSVGPNQRWTTIEDLKNAGCPSCSGKTFDRIGQRPAGTASTETVS